MSRSAYFGGLSITMFEESQSGASLTPCDAGSLGTKAEPHLQGIAGDHFVDYIDCIRVRTPHRYWQHPTIIKKIRKLCATAYWQPSHWGNYWYLNVTQPTDACLRVLDQMKAKLFYAEIARDYYDRTGDLLTTFRQHCVHKWKRQHTRQVQDTEYGGPRTSESNLVYYGKRSAKLNAYACHTEYRLRGVRALERVGITSLKSLLRFDYDNFWARKLCLRKVNLDRLASSLGCDRRDARMILSQHHGKVGNLIISLKQQIPAGNKRNYCFKEMALDWTSDNGFELVSKLWKQQQQDVDEDD